MASTGGSGLEDVSGRGDIEVQGFVKLSHVSGSQFTSLRHTGRALNTILGKLSTDRSIVNLMRQTQMPTDDTVSNKSRTEKKVNLQRIGESILSIVERQGTATAGGKYLSSSRRRSAAASPSSSYY